MVGATVDQCMTKCKTNFERAGEKKWSAVHSSKGVCVLDSRTDLQQWRKIYSGSLNAIILPKLGKCVIIDQIKLEKPSTLDT